MANYTFTDTQGNTWTFNGTRWIGTDRGGKYVSFFIVPTSLVDAEKIASVLRDWERDHPRKLRVFEHNTRYYRFNPKKDQVEFAYGALSSIWYTSAYTDSLHQYGMLDCGLWRLNTGQLKFLEQIVNHKLNPYQD